MSLPFEISPNLKKILGKLGRKDRNLALAVRKKMKQIVNSDISGMGHFKNLRHDSSKYKRVHISSSVLVFRLKQKAVVFEDFDHHDRIYNKR